MSKNDLAWELLFDELDIAARVQRDGLVVVTTKQIKEIGQREPRLMAKFDNSSMLPKSFRDNGFGLLPLSRSKYVVGNFDLFHPFPTTPGEIYPAESPTYLSTFAVAPASESVALHEAQAAGILADFLGENQVEAVLSGRMGSDAMAFKIGGRGGSAPYSIEVSGAQIEIDGGFEGENSVALIEVKRDLSDDFVIRQLYYPWFVWSKKLTKKVRPIYMVYGSGLFHLMEYEFTDQERYDSIRLVRNCTYYFPEAIVPKATIAELVRNMVPVTQPEVTFPQADRVERVAAVCELLIQGPMTATEISEALGFVERQASYYTTAARFLGYVEGRAGETTLTPRGRTVFELPLKDRTFQIAADILRHGAFLDTWKMWESTGVRPTTHEVAAVMQKHQVHDGHGNALSPVTVNRRAQTILGWVGWLRALDAPEQLAKKEFGV
ncbi:type II restriction enzyme [Corynebacterium ulceribovis]|uniref:type II restriction enzyme n=1 Tax=Corynebacterium ulceribovis TaxID=487732 RepID=UPI00036C30A2|nr:hypothetical protein [Corynebacterium ulceribovis]